MANLDLSMLVATRARKKNILNFSLVSTFGGKPSSISKSLKMIALTFIIAFIALLLIISYKQKSKKYNLPPGPLNLPLVGYLPLLGKFPHEALTKLSETYGDVYTIRLGSYRAVVLSSLRSIKWLKEETTTGRPRLPLFVIRSEGKGIIFNDGPVWSETRRFAVKHLKDFGFGKVGLEGIIQCEVQEFLQAIKCNGGKPIDLHNTINLAVINALWTIVAGQRFCSQNDSEGIQTVIEITQVVREFMVGNALDFLPWIPLVGPFKKLRQETLAKVQRLKDIMQRIVDEHLEDHVDGQETDFVHVFLNAVHETKDPESPFYGQDGIRNLMILLTDLFTAGAESTSASILWAILLMATYPEVQKKIQQEIDRVIPEGQTPSVEHRKLMPYTEAVLLETIRFSSTGPIAVTRRTFSDTKLLGFDIPRDTLLIPNLYRVMNDPQHWEKPSQFYPEHFLDSSGHLKVPEAFVAFGIGKRNCPGESLAKMELFLFIATLLQQFEFEFPAGEPKPSLEPVPGLVCPPQPYRVIPNPRKG